MIVRVNARHVCFSLMSTKQSLMLSIYVRICLPRSDAHYTKQHIYDDGGKFCFAESIPGWVCLFRPYAYSNAATSVLCTYADTYCVQVSIRTLFWLNCHTPLAFSPYRPARNNHVVVCPTDVGEAMQSQGKTSNAAVHAQCGSNI